MLLPSLKDIDVTGKKVLVRVDFNVPIHDGKVVNDARIVASLPTINYLLEKKAKVLLLSHLGRPQEGSFEKEYSLRPLKEVLEMHLGKEVAFVERPLELTSYDALVSLLENIRFLPGEKSNSAELSENLAGIADVFVLDAFATAHRAHASTTGVCDYIPVAVSGLLLEQELEMLDKLLTSPQRPFVAIVGGAKVSTKFGVLKNLISRVDTIIVGGGIANTFLKASGWDIGKSLYEEEYVPEVTQLLESAEKNGVDIIIPDDVVVSNEISNAAIARKAAKGEVADDDMILDLGPTTVAKIKNTILEAKTILWNGSLGVNEYKPFATGTKELAQAIEASDAVSIAGGGDTIAAIDSFGVRGGVSYVSTGGGALLEYLEGIELPALHALMRKRA